MDEKDREEKQSPRPVVKRTKPYQAPGIEWEEDIDVEANLASACGKIPPADALCIASPGS